MFHFFHSTCAWVVEDKALEEMVAMIIKSLSLKRFACVIVKATGHFPPIIQVNKRYSARRQNLTEFLKESI